MTPETGMDRTQEILSRDGHSLIVASQYNEHISIKTSVCNSLWESLHDGLDSTPDLEHRKEKNSDVAHF